jgi:hypothetical protein
MTRSLIHLCFSRARLLLACTGLLAAAAAGLVGGRAEAQAIDAPVVIPLYATDISSGGYKWGIYASLAGGTHQLFEFDTGGGGFYSVYSSDRSIAPWWGTNYTVINNNASNSYDSGYSYSGNTVQTAVRLYSSNGTPLLSLGGATVAQTVSIIDTKKHDKRIWDNGGSQVGTAPIDGAFYGDFGMDLGYNSNGIVNLVAQMQFTNGVTPGFIVNTPLNGSNGFLQIGLSASQTNQSGFNYFGMNVLSNSHTTASGTPFYNQSSVNLNLSISNSSTGSNYTTNIGIITDTGATPNIHNTQNASNPPFPADWIHTVGDKQFLTNDLILTLWGTNTEGATATVYNLTTSNTDDYSNFSGNVIVQDSASTHTNFSFNAGLYFFDHQQVIYDLQNGRIGLGPLTVPEPSVWCLLVAGLFVASLAGFRSLRAKRVKR